MITPAMAPADKTGFDGEINGEAVEEAATDDLEPEVAVAILEDEVAVFEDAVAVLEDAVVVPT